MQATLARWRGAPLAVLHNDDPDVAVARGAVAFALAQRGDAPKIGGGSPRSYFLVLDASGAGERRGVCVLPRGTEGGRELRLEGRRFALRLGQPVRFHLVSSTAQAAQRAAPRLGELVDLDAGDFARLPPIATVMQPAGAGRPREVPVELATALTEVGTLEMHCVGAEDASQRWRLEFQLRGAGASAGGDDAVPPRWADALERIDRVFGPRAKAVDAKEVRQLRAQLEALFGSRERWATPLLRRLFDALWQRARARRRSPDHERVWLNLAGWCLRPGRGDPLDEWRVEQLWTVFDAGVQHGHDARVPAEWWTLWRRVAGGLPEAAQRRLLDDFAYNLQGAAAGMTRPPHLVRGGYDDMVRLGASLERVPVEHKVEIGEWLFTRLGKAGTSDDLTLWAIGRIGARVPFHGSLHGVVPPEAASHWLESLLAFDAKRFEAAAFAVAQLARMTGDRARDVDEALRERVLARLRGARVAASWVAMVEQVAELGEADQRQAYGDALPPGLRLIG